MSSGRSQRPGDSTLVLPGEPQAERRPIEPVLVHLSGPWRGSTQRLRGDRLRLGAAVDAEIRVSPEPSVAPHHATLRWTGSGFELATEADRPVWVNGEAVRRRLLAAGDVLEIGRDGPLLRYRIYPPGTRRSKSVGEAFADGVDAARFSKRSRPARAALGAAGAVRELAMRAPLWFRLAATALLLALLAITVWQLQRSQRLEHQLELERLRVEGLSGLVDQTAARLSGEELTAIRGELVTALQRVEALEARSGAAARVVAAAAPSVALLQGSYGFEEPVSGRQLRFLGFDETGRPLRDATGEPIVGVGGDGPPVEIYFTGTAFVVGDDGSLLSNRHLAEPWRYEATAQRAITHGLRPAMRRFLAYLPGVARPFPVLTVEVSELADLATLVAPEMTGQAPPLALRQRPATTGEAVLVLGYPAGIRAILARADAQLMDTLMRDRELDFWQVAERLSRSGQIGPLASRGIVAQVTPSAVVYDAETTQGGSGGPVLGLDGQVVAVTSAVITEFGGSNLGVPAELAAMLLAQEAMGRLTAGGWR